MKNKKMIFGVIVLLMVFLIPFGQCAKTKYLGSYGEFVEYVHKNIKPEYEDHYDVIKIAIMKYKYFSVNTRGHWIWHLSAVLLTVLWLSMSLWFVFGSVS